MEKDPKKAVQLYLEASGFTKTNQNYTVSIETDPGDSQNNVLLELNAEIEKDKVSLETIRQQIAEKENQISDKQHIAEVVKLALAEQRESIDAEKHKADLERGKLKELKQEISSLKKQLDTIRKEQTALEPGKYKIDIAGPSIQLIHPPILNVRGIPQVNIDANKETTEILGQVVEPAGFSQLLVNNTKVAVDHRGLFKFEVQIKNTNTAIRIITIDRLEKRAELEFEFVKSDKPSGVQKVAGLQKFSDEFGKFYALVIGDSDYKNFPKLSTAVADAEGISDILSKRYGFKIVTLINANRFMILSALIKLSKKLERNDNLLIYFAGHGEVGQQQTGYWLPVDAERTNTGKWI